MTSKGNKAPGLSIDRSLRFLRTSLLVLSRRSMLPGQVEHFHWFYCWSVPFVWKTECFCCSDSNLQRALRYNSSFAVVVLPVSCVYHPTGFLAWNSKNVDGPVHLTWVVLLDCKSSKGENSARFNWDSTTEYLRKRSLQKMVLAITRTSGKLPLVKAKHTITVFINKFESLRSNEQHTCASFA